MISDNDFSQNSNIHMQIKSELHTHFLLEKRIEKLSSKDPKDSSTVTPCPSEAIVKEEISAVFHNPYTMY